MNRPPEYPLARPRKRTHWSSQGLKGVSHVVKRPHCTVERHARRAEGGRRQAHGRHEVAWTWSSSTESGEDGRQLVSLRLPKGAGLGGGRCGRQGVQISAPCPGAGANPSASGACAAPHPTARPTGRHPCGDAPRPAPQAPPRALPSRPPRIGPHLVRRPASWLGLERRDRLRSLGRIADSWCRWGSPKGVTLS